MVWRTGAALVLEEDAALREDHELGAGQDVEVGTIHSLEARLVSARVRICRVHDGNQRLRHNLQETFI